MPKGVTVKVWMPRGPHKLYPPSPSEGVLLPILELRAIYNLPAGFRGGAAGGQGQLGKESEQGRYPLHG